MSLILVLPRIQRNARAHALDQWEIEVIRLNLVHEDPPPELDP
jgi:hypothetical protein